MEEQNRQVIRSKLNAENIKLWLPPYTVPSEGKGQFPKDFIVRYSEELKLDEAIVTETLEALRLHALEKIASRRQASDLISLKIKLAGNVPPHISKEEKSFSLEIVSSDVVALLKDQISALRKIEKDFLKLISAGKLLEDTHALNSYQLKNGATIMAICLSKTEVQARREQARAERFARMRQGAELLASKEDGGRDGVGNYYVQVTDQKGRPLEVPPDQRKALVLAMTLHEKGRSFLKRKEYGEGLLLLLEADKEFKKCNSDIFSAVDNYAILCLDIVWCYLCLKNVNDLPDAEDRLNACDRCFRTSYGPNLERLALLKGGTGSERALFMRLHLLQGVLAYHQNKIEQANALLKRAESELGSLRVDDSKMSQLLSMGFTQREARLALRLTEGNVQLAAEHIFARREEKKDQKKREKDEKKKKKLESKLGFTQQGKPVSVDAYVSLKSMGFPNGAAAEALRICNNNINDALQALSDSPHLLSQPDPEVEKFELTDTMLSQLSALGFETDVARVALSHFQNVEAAVDALLRSHGAPLPEWFNSLSSLDLRGVAGELDLQGPQPANSEAQQQPSTSRDAAAAERELIHSVIEDLPQDDEDHLDITLDEEAQILQEYLTCLASSQEHRP